MKKSLAAQVKAFMDAHADDAGSPMSAAAMAALVASHQGGLPAANRCKRQDIENLLKKNFRTTRYMPALAAAMGVTVEDLVGLKAGSAPDRPSEAAVREEAGLSSERITRYVSDVSQSLVEFARLLDKPQRTLLRGLMGDLLSNPEAFAFLDRDQVRALLSDNAFRDDPEPRSADSSDPFTDVDEHSVTNEAETTHRTERDGPPYSISTKRRAPRAG